MRTTAISVVLRATLALLLAVSATAGLADHATSPRLPAANAASDFVVSEDKGLLSLQAVNIDLAQVLAALSRASGVPIELIGQAGAKDKLTISFHDLTLPAAINAVMSTLPAGGFASITSGAGAKPTLYVATAQAAENIRSTARALIARIHKGEKPTPADLSASLVTVAAFGFKVDPQSTSTLILPALQLMDANYGTYDGSVSSIFRDPDVMRPLRSAMLELIERHWDYPDSRNSLLAVFDRTTDDMVLQGQTALILARHREDIGDRVIARYSSATSDARFYYAQALTTLGRMDARALIAVDALQTQDMSLRSICVDALISLDPASPQTSAMVNEVIRSAPPVAPSERADRDFGNERVAMHAVEALGRYGGAEARQKLLSIAADEAVAIDVRLTALESLTAAAVAMPTTAKSSLYDWADELQHRVTASRELSEVSKERMLARLSKLARVAARTSGGGHE